MKATRINIQRFKKRYRHYYNNASSSSSLTKTSNTPDYFLNEAFVNRFIRLNVLPKLNLPDDVKLSNCKINFLKRRSSKAAIEFILDLYYKRNLHRYQQQQQQKIFKSIVGKWRSDGQGKQIFDLLQQVWKKGFAIANSNFNLKMYEPIAYFPSYNLMITSKAEGTRLKELLIECNYDDIEAVEVVVRAWIMNAAKWLAKLHSIPLPIHNSRSLSLLLSIQNEEKKLKVWSQHLTHLYPDFAKRVSNITSKILQMEKLIVNPRNFVLIHGDFHSGNIFVDQDNNLTVIDFEQSCIFDPAFDLAYFIIKLISIKRKYQLSSLNTRDLEKCFVDIYYNSTAREIIPTALSTSSLTTTKKLLLKRLAIFKARNCIEHLHSRYCQHLHSIYWGCYAQHKPDPVDFKYWLNKAEQIII